MSIAVMVKVGSALGAMEYEFGLTVLRDATIPQLTEAIRVIIVQDPDLFDEILKGIIERSPRNES